MSRNRPTIKIEAGFGAGPLQDISSATTSASASTGNTLTAPDAAALRWSTRLDIRFKVALSDWTPSASQIIAQKHTGGGVAPGWFVTVNTDGTLQMTVNDTGGNAYAASFTPPPFVDGAAYWFRFRVDYDSGSNPGFTMRLYVSASGSSWTEYLGTSGTLALQFFSSTLGPNPSTANLALGSSNHSAGTVKFLAFLMFIDKATTPAAALDLDNLWAITDTTWVDQAGNTWTAGASMTLASLWTDVTADWRGQMTPSPMGRGSELDSFSTGSMGLTLANADRKYDPSYSAGTYFGKLLSRVPIRARAKYSSVVYNLFRGLVDGGWQQGYDAGNHYATVTISAKDDSIVLGDAPTPSSALDASIGLDKAVSAGLAGWWKLDNQTQLADLSGNGNDLPVNSSPVSIDSIVVGSSRAASVLADNCNAARAAAPITAYPFTVEAWVQSSAVFDYTQTSSNSVALFAIQTAAGANLFSFAIDWRGPVINGTLFPAVSTIDTKSTTRILDGKPHHVCVVVQSIGCSMYVDGAVIAVAVSSLGSLSTAARLVVGQTGAALSATVDQVTVWSRLLGTQELQRRASAGLYGRPAETSAERAGFVLEAANWPGYRVALDGGTICQPYVGSDDTKVLDYLRTIEATERGQAFLDAGGTWHLRKVTANFSDARSTAVQHDFAETDYIADGFQIEADDERIVNTSDVTRAGGQKSSAADLTSQQRYGQKALSITDTLNMTDVETQAMAGYYVWLGKDQGERIDALPIKPDTIPATLYPIVLGSRIGDLFTVERTPQKVGSALTVEAHLAGAPSHVIDAEDWVTTFLLDSQQARPGAVLQWGSWAWLDGKTWGP